MKYFSLFLLFLFIATQSFAQPGCIDPQAVNYNSEAMTNDGSCTYGLTEYTMRELTVLPASLEECSGLAWIDNNLWIHNDGGNEDKIYQIDSLTGMVSRSVTIATADNNDWEDITTSDNYLYIGDIGNNPGNRTDLGVFRVLKSDLSSNVVNADFIGFEYSDQTDFTENSNNHNFDSEAIVFYNDSLHLFSKNWSDSQTKHYILPATPGNHVAQLVETFDVEMLVTGADVTADGEMILLGYNSFGFSFMWLLFDYEGSQFFSGNKRRISLGFGTTNGQTEGIVFREDGSGYVCSESFKVNGQVFSEQKLFSFTVDQWIDYSTAITELDDTYQVLAYPNPFQGFIEIKLSRPIDQLRLYDMNGRMVNYREVYDDQLQLKIDTDELSPGLYFMEIIKDGRSKIVELTKH